MYNKIKRYVERYVELKAILHSPISGIPIYLLAVCEVYQTVSVCGKAQHYFGQRFLFHNMRVLIHAEHLQSLCQEYFVWNGAMGTLTRSAS